MAKTTFDETLAVFVSATAKSMEAALLCSHLAIQYFAEFGDLGQAQRFLDAMPKNYVRRAAFLKWLAAHAPVTMEKGKLIKDHSENAADWNVDVALIKPFWDFAPDKEDIQWGKDDLVSQLNKLIKRYSADRYVANDDVAAQSLGKLEKFAANL